MTLSSDKSSYKAQNYFAFSTTDIEKNNSDTFTTTEPLGFEAFYYTMLNSYKDSFFLGDPLGPNKPLGSHVLMIIECRSVTTTFNPKLSEARIDFRLVLAA